MRLEIVAVGTELLLGQVVDTNSAWMGQRLALAGVDVLHRSAVGDNPSRIAAALRVALGRSDAVVVCGGLGPTPDDVTREAVAEVLAVPLVRDAAVLARIEALFRRRGRSMSAGNDRQADVPVGAAVIPQRRGTAPGLICPVGPPGRDGRSRQVVYVLPGVPHEMAEMFDRAVVGDLRGRMPTAAIIVSRILRTWGLAESTLAQRLAPRLAALDAAPGGPTLAFLASGVEGIKVRITAKAPTSEEAGAMLDAEEGAVRALLGDVVFGTDDESMEHVVGALLVGRNATLGVAESLTGGMLGARLTEVAGSSQFFRGSVVAYNREVKHGLLGVPVGPVVSEAAAAAMASGARRVLGAGVGLSATGVAGPTEQDDQPVGTVWLGLDVEGDVTTRHVRLPGERELVRQLATICALDFLRRRLLGLVPEPGVA